jgi:hypothetical protein
MKKSRRKDATGKMDKKNLCNKYLQHIGTQDSLSACNFNPLPIISTFTYPLNQQNPLIFPHFPLLTLSFFYNFPPFRQSHPAILLRAAFFELLFLNMEVGTVPYQYRHHRKIKLCSKVIIFMPPPGLLENG